MTVQLNVQGNPGATGTEVTDFGGAARSLRGHMELCQGAHQALLRLSSLLQEGCSTGARCELRAVRMALAVARQSCSSRHHPKAPALPLAPAAAARPWLPGLWQELCISLCPWQSVAPDSCQSVLYTYIHTFICVCVCICPEVLFKI